MSLSSSKYPLETISNSHKASGQGFPPSPRVPETLPWRSTVLSDHAPGQTHAVEWAAGRWLPQTSSLVQAHPSQ